MKTSEFMKDLKGCSPDELREKARQLSEELLKLRFRKASGQLEQGHRICQVRRGLARARTILTQRLAVQGGEE